MNQTSIGWTEITWNPTTGCDKISPGCAFCYAETIAENKRGTAGFPVGFDLQYRAHKLDEPRRLKRPSLIFVNSMSDLFWEAISDDYRDRVLDVIEQTPQHQYQVLTKRAANLLRYSRRRRLPANFWAGVSVESPVQLDRVGYLRRVDAEIRFVSFEPLLAEIRPDLSEIAWAIGGGESGNHLTQARFREPRALVDYFVERKTWTPRPSRYGWARALRDACQSYGTAFFWKQWGGRTPLSAGRLLDGKTWSEFPRYPESGERARSAGSLPAQGRLL